jgi:tRNA threonylcarbamoyladenosine biosynthesis protein TsaB
MTDSPLRELPWLLALDTSTDWAGVALTDGAALAEMNWTAGRHQTTQVMPEVVRLLSVMGIDASCLGAVAVAIGPGSFSGLRVGMALANGIAVASGIPIIGVSTLELTVHGWSSMPGSAVGVIKAGRTRYGWASESDIAIPTSGDISELIDFVRAGGHGLVLGELSEEDAIRIRELTRAVVPPPPTRQRRAGALARIGWQRWQSGAADPATVLEPIYLHRS